jgi:hypothetical protein
VSQTLPIAATMTAKELLARLRRHYLPPQPMPGGIFVHEVAFNGAQGSRCDAIYVGFTSASGRRLVGHEIKVSRADWRHELDQPGKADAWHDQCHEWWIVAPSTEVVPPAELPAGWGLMVPNPRTKTRMDKIVRAEVKKIQPSWNAVRSVMARAETLMRADIAAEVDKRIEAKERQYRDDLAAARRAACSLAREHDELADIKETLGLDEWRARDDLKIAVAAVRESRDLRDALRHLTDGYVLRSLRQAVSAVEDEARKVAAVLNGEATP